MIGRTLGRYRITGKLGEGGMATVWKADDPLLERCVAVKVLARALAQSAEAQSRFRHEAEVALLLDHPAITPVFDSGVTGDDSWMTMAFVNGETLAERMRQSLLPVPEACEIAAVIASALGYAHARGVLHRDVSPRNIMLASDGRTLLLDFGLALVDGASRVTRSGIVPGTLAYMAPEALSESTTDPRSDLYSLAAVLYEMVTGAPPHAAQNREALLYAKLNLKPRKASELRPDVSEALDSLLARTLARDPGQRPADAEEFMNELRDRPASAAPVRTPRSAGELLAKGDGVVYLGVPAFDCDAGEAPALLDLGLLLAAALRRRLGSVRRMHVVQAGEPLGASGDVLDWATRHGANLVLHARARQQGSRVRIECALLDPAGGVALAGEIVEGSMLDLFDLEDRLVAAARTLFPVLHHEFEELATTEPDVAGGPSAADHVLQALRYLQRHDHEPSVDAAIGLLERRARSTRATAEQLAALARAYLIKYQLTHQHVWETRAATVVERAVRVDASLPAVQLALADLKAASGHGAEASGLYRKLLSSTPEQLEGWIGLARLHTAHAEYEQAEEACRRAIALRPRDWRGYSMLGTVYFRQGRYSQAAPPWRRVLRLSPEHARAASNLGAALFHMDRLEDCEAAFRRSLELEPSPAAYANLGTVLYAQHRFEESMANLQRACDLRPADARFWGYLAVAAREVPGSEETSRRAYERAIGLMRESLERNAEDAQGWAILAGWYAARSQAVDSRAAITRALEIAPRDVRVIVEAASAHALLGDHELALDYLEQAVGAGHAIHLIERRMDLRSLHSLERYQQLVAGARTTSRPAPPR